MSYQDTITSFRMYLDFPFSKDRESFACCLPKVKLGRRITCRILCKDHMRTTTTDFKFQIKKKGKGNVPKVMTGLCAGNKG